MSDTSELPPPPPSAVPDESATGRSRTVLATLAIVGAVAALVFGLLWISASGSRNDAVQERDLALSERDAATANGIELSNELRATKDQLADTEAALASAGSTESGPADTSEIADLETDVDRLTTEVDRLTTENETLRADLDAARSAPETTIVAPTTVAPETTVAPDTVVAPTTETVLPSAAELGQWLSSLYRTSVLGSGQRDCLGQVVIDDLGADQLSEILNSGDDAAGNDILIASLRAAASTCGIDPSAVFG